MQFGIFDGHKFYAIVQCPGMGSVSYAMPGELLSPEDKVPRFSSIWSSHITCYTAILIFTGNWNKYCSVYQDAWYGRSIEGDITIIATGETSQAITSLTIFTSLASITR